MRRIVALGIALGMTAVLGSFTLGHADCAYHKSQAAVEQGKTVKEVVSLPIVDKTAADQLQTAQSDKSSKPAPQVKN